jgi:hypothetical protein
LDSDSTGFAGFKSALRSFERWLTFCCIVIPLAQLTGLLINLWRIDSIHPPT